jgi:hypothetical protein
MGVTESIGPDGKTRAGDSPGAGGAETEVVTRVGKIETRRRGRSPTSLRFSAPYGPG